MIPIARQIYALKRFDQLVRGNHGPKQATEIVRKEIGSSRATVYNIRARRKKLDRIRLKNA